MSQSEEESAKALAPAPLEGELLPAGEGSEDDEDEDSDIEAPRAPRSIPRPDKKLLKAMERNPVVRRGWERIEQNYREKPLQNLPPAHMANAAKDAARLVNQFMEANGVTPDQTDYSHRLFPRRPALEGPEGANLLEDKDKSPSPPKERALASARADVAAAPPDRVFLAWAPLEGGGLSAQMAWEVREGSPLRTRAIDIRPGPKLSEGLGAFRAALEGKDAFVWDTPPLFRAISDLLAGDEAARKAFEPLHLWLKATTAKSLCCAVYSVPHEQGHRLEFSAVARRLGVPDLSNAYEDAPLAARLLRVQRRLQGDLLRKRDGLPVDPLEIPEE